MKFVLFCVTILMSSSALADTDWSSVLKQDVLEDLDRLQTLVNETTGPLEVNSESIRCAGSRSFYYDDAIGACTFFASAEELGKVYVLTVNGIMRDENQYLPEWSLKVIDENL